jgi:hypothetical protein
VLIIAFVMSAYAIIYSSLQTYLAIFHVAYALKVIVVQVYVSMMSTAAIVEALAVHEVIAVDDDDKGNTKTRGSLRVGYHV